MRGIYKKKFNEKIYHEDTYYAPVHGRFLWYLFRKLQKFNDTTEYVVANLLPNGKRYLDVGCGDGNLCFKVKDKFEEILGVDIAENRIRRAKIRQRKAHFFVADLDEMLPFKDGIFDAVSCIATFQYCFDPYQVIKEFHRTLKRNGIFVIQVTNIAWFPYRIKLLFGGLFITSLAQSYGWDGGVLHYFTFQTLEDFLEKKGFKIMKKTGSGIFSKWRRWWLSLLSGDVIIKATKV